MRVRTIIAFLIFIVLSFTIYSFGFAQVDLANQIIEKRIDELWTTGKLNIGYANIASRHWLPSLYERNNFQLLWQNPQNVKGLLAAVGSIAEDGLDPEDYHLSDLLVLKLSLDDSKSPDPKMLADYDNRRLREIEYHELKDIDVGSWFAPEFSSERIPTLQEAIDVARSRIKLNIELKFTWTDPALAEKAGTIIWQKEFFSECVVSSSNFQALMEIKQAFPEITTGFIVFKAVGNLSRMETGFLSINAAKATPRMVRQVHRHGRAVHVWTVNDFNNVISMIEVGVDNIITDYPQKVRGYLEAWNALSGSEKIALMLRNLIVEIERPQPSDL